MMGSAVYRGETVLIFDKYGDDYLIHYDRITWVPESELEDIKLRKRHPGDFYFDADMATIFLKSK